MEHDHPLLLRSILKQRHNTRETIKLKPAFKNVAWGELLIRNPNQADKREPIPEITKSERKELVAEELKDYFPDSEIGGLVVRRRKNSSASIDLDAPAEPEENFSTRRRRGSSTFDLSENGDTPTE